MIKQLPSRSVSSPCGLRIRMIMMMMMPPVRRRPTTSSSCIMRSHTRRIGTITAAKATEEEVATKSPQQPIASPPMTMMILSRRVYDRFCLRQQQLQDPRTAYLAQTSSSLSSSSSSISRAGSTSSSGSSSSSSTSQQQQQDQRPWPKSVVYTAYMAGSVLIPYFAVWIMVSNPTLRSLGVLAEDIMDDADDINDDNNNDDNNNNNNAVSGLGGDGETKGNNNSGTGGSKSTRWQWRHVITTWIRQHFGTIDYDSISYVEHHNHYHPPSPSSPKQPLPYDYPLPGELSRHDRIIQQEIQKRNQQLVQVRVRLYQHTKDGTTSTTTDPYGSAVAAAAADHINNAVPFITTQLQVPGSVRANPEQLLALLAEKQLSTATYASAAAGVVVALDFPEDPKISPSPPFNATTTSDSFTGVDMKTDHDHKHDWNEGTSTTSAKPDDDDDYYLNRSMQTHSTWYYQAPIQASMTGPTNTTSNSSTSHWEQQVRMEQLQDEIKLLQQELDQGSTSRHIDDVLEDIRIRKAELRQLYWQGLWRSLW